MSRLHFILLAASSVAFLGCTRNAVVDDAEKSVPSFPKKQECQKYIASAKKILAQADVAAEDSASGWREHSTFIRVFYSRSLDTCLYEWMRYSYSGRDLVSGEWLLTDVLSGEQVVSDVSLDKFISPEWYAVERRFEERVKQYE